MALAAVLTTDDQWAPPAQTSRGPLSEHRPAAAAGREASPTPGRILVAEDDSELRRSLVDLFQLPGYTVLEASDGDQTVARLADRPDVIVLDLHMPRRDGLAVLEALGGEPPPYVILYSAFSLYHPEQLDERGLRDRVFRVLRKPVPPAQLLAAVADALAEIG